MSGYCRGRNASLQPLKRVLHGASIKCITILGSEVGAMSISLHAASMVGMGDADEGTGDVHVPLVPGL